MPAVTWEDVSGDMADIIHGVSKEHRLFGI